MSLEYTDLEQVKNEYVSINGITDSLHKLVENDERILLTLNNKPGVWEAKWYNDDTIAGYQRGAAVWLNTEDIDHLIDVKFDEIRHYILNSEYKGEYLSISSDNIASKELFKNVCNGTGGYRRLYYIGNMSSPAQVRVSKIDNNKDDPTKSTWGDSFRLSSVQSYQNIIRNEASVLIDQNIATHIQNYHLSSMTLRELTSNYLLNDFSNISLKQTLNTHNIWNRGERLVGFDKISLFVTKKTANGSQWFRLWSSGFLEHGGNLSFSGSIITATINLDWTYGTDSKHSVVYDYQVLYDDMYAMNEEIWVGSSKQQINQNNIGKQTTYDITVTPVVTLSQKMQSPTVELFNITNSRFSFSCESKCNNFTYATAGFVTQPTIRRLGL